MDEFRYDESEFLSSSASEPEQEQEPMPETVPERPVRRRKKKKSFFRRLLRLPPRILLAALAILVVIVVVIVAVAKGCSAKPENPILAQAFQSKSELMLPVDTTLNSGDFLAYGGYQFETKKSLSAMEKLVVKNNENVTSTTYTNAAGSCCVFTRPGDVGTDQWCLYQKDPNLAKNLFIFMGMQREVSMPDGKLSILLPLHLISDSDLRDNMGACLELGKAYTCGLDKMDGDQTLAGMFRGFYEESGKYVVISSSVGFSMYPKADSSRELIFSFDEADGAGKFVVTVPVEPEPEPSAVAEVLSFAVEGAAPVSLPEGSAIELSDLVLHQSFQPGEPFEDAVEYALSINGDVYDLVKSWQADSWSVRLTSQSTGAAAKLSTKDSCTVMAILGASGVPGVPTRDVSDWAGDVDTAFSPSPAHMVTTADVNVRTLPATNGSQILMTMPNGSSVAVVARNAAGWCEIWYNNRLAYMKADYLKLVD